MQNVLDILNQIRLHASNIGSGWNSPHSIFNIDVPVFLLIIFLILLVILFPCLISDDKTIRHIGTSIFVLSVICIFAETFVHDYNTKQINQKVETKYQTDLDRELQSVAKDRPYTFIVKNHSYVYVCFSKSNSPHNLKPNIACKLNPSNNDDHPSKSYIASFKTNDSETILNPNKAEIIKTQDAGHTLMNLMIDHATYNYGMHTLFSNKIPD